ncbi:unnamed protein product [Caenorhabditis auriculariae]|uniref:Protein-tyrosine-phosphatase n=1 Tax=Caenorhabditis auriculariae TaxID=2777116 RepID=A0A8S1H301_9PELO|nr:unnamed protein product [Caenorhabditis auriculariae]
MCVTKKNKSRNDDSEVGSCAEKLPKTDKETYQSNKENEASTPRGTTPVIGDSMKVAKSSEKSKEKVLKWIHRTLEMGVDGLVAEFQKIPKVDPKSFSTKAFSENKEKNRYQDVPCQDNDRVVLTFPGVSTDYIHANYVGTAIDKRRFICTQGPLEKTLFDFWAMVIQEKCETIIMLCNFCEQDKIKCEPYWPSEKNEEPKKQVMKFGTAPNEITVSSPDKPYRMKEDAGINITVLKVEWVEGGDLKSRQVRHYQWESWPDRGVPQNKLTPTELLSYVRGNPNPIVVHCSAGIGRTGTIVAIAYVQERMQAGKDCMEMVELVLELRRHRPYSIQNDMQYLYLHRVLLAYFLEKHQDKLKLPAESRAKFDEWVARYDTLTKG